MPSLTEQEMMQSAREAVLGGTACLPVSRELDGKVVCLHYGGRKLCPAYCFDGAGSPIPAVEEILRVLTDGGRLPFPIACWFESVNSMLAGRRPRDLLVTDPAAVIEAARDEAVGPLHG